MTTKFPVTVALTLEEAKLVAESMELAADHLEDGGGDIDPEIIQHRKDLAARVWDAIQEVKNESLVPCERCGQGIPACAYEG